MCLYADTKGDNFIDVFFFYLKWDNFTGVSFLLIFECETI